MSLWANTTHTHALREDVLGVAWFMTNTLIQPTNNNGQNPAGGLVHGQHVGGTQVLCSAGYSRERTHTTTPIDSNYPDEEVSLETERELARLKLEKELLMEMLKEQLQVMMVSNL